MIRASRPCALVRVKTRTSASAVRPNRALTIGRRAPSVAAAEVFGRTAATAPAMSSAQRIKYFRMSAICLAGDVFRGSAPIVSAQDPQRAGQRREIRQQREDERRGGEI